MAIAQKRNAVTTSVPSPIGGWNARDSQANMSPTDAIQLVNWFPTPTDVTLRKGYTRISTITTATGVQTISSITYAGLIATLTTAAAHGLTTGQYVSITGTTPAAYSGVFVPSTNNPNAGPLNIETDGNVIRGNAVSL